MPQAEQNSERGRVANLKSTANLMTLNPGLFCVFYAQGQSIGTQAGLPAVRVSQAPGSTVDITITSMSADGWLGASDGAALIKVAGGSGQILVTSYDFAEAQRDMPKLQVVQLAGNAAADTARNGAAVPNAPVAPQPPPSHVEGAAGSAPVASKEKPEVAAHIQRRGDVVARLGEWMGAPGSQAWIEGFGISPQKKIPPEDIEYQAVLGKGWLSPWSDGGQFCGSRGMALPILGLRVRLKGASEHKFAVKVSASFTDGTRVGPLGSDVTAEAESLAPLEAFLVEIQPKNATTVATNSEKASPTKATAGRAKKAFSVAEAKDTPQTTKPSPEVAAKKAVAPRRKTAKG